MVFSKCFNFLHSDVAKNKAGGKSERLKVNVQMKFKGFILLSLLVGSQNIPPHFPIPTPWTRVSDSPLGSRIRGLKLMGRYHQNWVLWQFEFSGAHWTPYNGLLEYFFSFFQKATRVEIWWQSFQNLKNCLGSHFYDEFYFTKLWHF